MINSLSRISSNSYILISVRRMLLIRRASASFSAPPGSKKQLFSARKKYVISSSCDQASHFDEGTAQRKRGPISSPVGRACLRILGEGKSADLTGCTHIILVQFLSLKHGVVLPGYEE
uniref:Uncharacterized protein n=1 Tax=Picea glauca TaxID=3330 RepID=A0A117NIA0_PICGL|nr:hypothetical protein ABT39_MTgene2820 [Picea glauca]QHR87645.1 hypothetical protein Q903MT_gene1657 [Picea sitchensis]